VSKGSFHEYSPGTAISNGERTYVIGERFSHDNFGFDYVCRDEWENSLRLRVLWPLSRPYEDVREKWKQQAEELRRVQHPNLIHLHDAFEHDGSFHLVSEHFESRLSDLIQEPGWDGAGWFLAVAGSVLCALDHIHRAGYTHRDLHPHNVFFAVSPQAMRPDAPLSGAVKVGGLPVTCLLGNVDVLNSLVARWLVPPEYLNPSEFGRQMDQRVDIYQASLLLLAVLKGRLPRFTFEDTVLQAPAKAAEVETGWGTVLARALQPKVEDRFVSALEFWRALREVSP